MKFIKYIPSIIFSLIEMAIVASVLSNAEFSSYKDVMSGLAIIYASIRTFAISMGISINSIVLGLSKEIIDIKERIKTDTEIEYDRESLKEASQKISTTNIKLIIRSIGIAFIYLIALSSLLN